MLEPSNPLWIIKEADLRAQKSGEKDAAAAIAREQAIQVYRKNPPSPPVPAPENNGSKPETVKVIAIWDYSPSVFEAGRQTEQDLLAAILKARTEERKTELEHRLVSLRETLRHVSASLHEHRYTASDGGGTAALQEAMMALSTGLVSKVQFKGGVILTLFRVEIDPVTGKEKKVAFRRKFFAGVKAAFDAGNKAKAEGVDLPTAEQSGIVRRERLDAWRPLPVIPEGLDGMSRRQRARVLSEREAPRVQIAASGLSKDQRSRLTGIYGEALRETDLHVRTVEIVDYTVLPEITASEVKEFALRPELDPYLSPHQRAARKPASRNLSYSGNNKHWGKASQDRYPSARAHSPLRSNWGGH